MEGAKGIVDYHPLKTRINRYFAKHVGEDRRPTYFDIDTVYPSLNQLTENYPIIRREFELVLSRRFPVPTYHDLDTGERELSAVANPGRKWSLFMLHILGHRPHLNCALCPQTCRLLDRIPGLVQAFFSVLDPCKSIPPHDAPYLGYLRYHLGLCISKENPPRLIVNSQEHVWQSGHAVLFDDSWRHEVINHSNEIRAVLIVDVLRPMPLLPTLVNKVATRCLMRPLYGRAIARKTSYVASQAVG